jgi:hypothetical protein
MTTHPTTEPQLLPAVIEPSAEWLQQRDECLAIAATFDAVESDSQAAHAMEIVGTLGKLGKALREVRLGLTRPLDEAKRALTNHEKELAADYEGARRRLKDMCTTWATEQERLRQEAKRMDDERRAQAEVDRQATQDAMDAFGVEMGVDAMHPAPAAPARPGPVKVAGARVVVRYDWEIVNAAEVPHELCSVDAKKVRAHIEYCRKMDRKPEIPGIRIDEKRSVEGR